MNRSLSAFAAALLLLAGGSAFAHEFKVGSLRVGHPWSRATPDAAKVGGGYLTVENGGSTADRLVAVEIPFAARGEIHEMAVTNGVMTMRELEKGVEIPAGGKVEFKPGGLHLMFMGLKQPLKQGEKVKGTLTFEKAGKLDVEFAVEGVGARQGAATDPHKAH